MNKAIMIGAGQIGRGFIGMELEKAGYHVLFADINQDVIDDINTRGEYTVHVLDTERIDIVVKNISAVSSLDPDFPDAFAEQDVTLVCTSVGQSNLCKVAPIIAKGIVKRMSADIFEPMNIIAVENAIGGTDQLKKYIYVNLDEKSKNYADRMIGFPNSAVDRIIPPDKNWKYAADSFVERYFEWDLEKSKIKAEILSVNGLNIVDNLMPYLERKFFTLNGPNAVTACLGYLKGYITINEALNDAEIYEVVWNMMEECGAMLQKRHGFSADQMLNYRKTLMQRFLNPYIVDSITRVAREPIRKLSPNDRIIVPFNYAYEYGLKTTAYCTGVSAMLMYNNPDDTQSVELQKMLSEFGVEKTLDRVCGICTSDDRVVKISEEYTRLKRQYGK